MKLFHEYFGDRQRHTQHCTPSGRGLNLELPPELFDPFLHPQQAEASRSFGVEPAPVVFNADEQ